MPGFLSNVKRSWNAFIRGDPANEYSIQYGYGYASSNRPDRTKLKSSTTKSIVGAIINRIAIDGAAIAMEHADLDENERFVGERDSGLNTCLKIEANIDQTGRNLRQDIIASMLDEGVVAVVPVVTSKDPSLTESYDIYELRTAKIVQWYPRHVRVRLYNEQTGRKQDITLPKHMVAIIENPLYAVMNEPNSTVQRLIRKLNLLDYIDEQSGKNKLDLIIQLPYPLKTEKQQKAAKRRQQEIETQLTGSTYGIAYIDATEHITQLNRPVENNLLAQIKELTTMTYGQLGMTESVMLGTASEQEMLNYYSRTIEPILANIVDEFTRKFLSKTARSQRQAIVFFRDVFRLAPLSVLAELAAKFTSNEIITSNEVRGAIGMKPSDDPRADKLQNKNINPYPQEQAQQPDEEEEDVDDEYGHY